MPDPLQTVRHFADLLLAHGRDTYGPRHSPLIVGQLNPRTLRIPSGNPDDAGLFADNPELAGCGPHCVNLLFDFGLFDTLTRLTRITGETRYADAWQEHAAYFLQHCRHPTSGYFPWGEHVGYDIVRDAIHQGDYKGWHEVKVARIPWEELHRIDSDATRHEVETALFNHVCDPTRMTFNRHASMDGQSNLGGGPCSLATSAGTFIEAWTWLHSKTGDGKFLGWADRLDRLFWDSRNPKTGLFPSSEDRPTELWYGDVLDFSVSLLAASQYLDDAGQTFRAHAMDYLASYHRLACDRSASGGGAFFDTLNIETGEPVIGPSRHYPEIIRPRHLGAWEGASNSIKVVAVTSGAAFAMTGSPWLCEAFDAAISALDVAGRVREEKPIVAGDVAGVILALLHVAVKSEDEQYVDTAALLVEHALRHNVQSGILTSGLGGSADVYSSRAGCGDLAAALLAFAIVKEDGLEGVELPAIRQPLGAMPW